MDKQVWFKPSQIAKDRMILDPNGQGNYRYIIRLIGNGELVAKVWTHKGRNTEGAEQRPYYMVHIDEIKKFNEAHS